MAIDNSHRITSADGIVRLDSRHAEDCRLLRPPGPIKKVLHESDKFKPKEGVLDHGDTDQGREDLIEKLKGKYQN